MDKLRSDTDPWHPMTDPVAIKTLGKFLEELGELTAAVSRCLIQGIAEVAPDTGKPNIEWLEDEMADVTAGMQLAQDLFNLNVPRMIARADFKIEKLRRWHEKA